MAIGGIALCVAVVSAALALLVPARRSIGATHRDGRTVGRSLPGATIARRVVAARRREQGSACALEVLRGTHAAMRSGLPLAPALRVALERVDAADRAPFERAMRAFELNEGLEDALAAARATARDRRVSLALDALALVASEQVPASRGAALVQSVADRLSFEERLLAEVRARTGGVRAQIVILALLVPSLAAYLAITMPGLATTLATPLGRLVLIPAAVLLEIVGIAASRAIVRDLAR